MPVGFNPATQPYLNWVDIPEAQSKPPPGPDAKAADPDAKPATTGTSQTTTTASVTAKSHTNETPVGAAEGTADAALTRVDADAAGLKDGKVTAAQYYQDDQRLVTAYGKELGVTYNKLISTVCVANPEAAAEAAVLGRHPNDKEGETALKAAEAVRQVMQARGSTAQMAALEKALPVGVDPSIKRLVMGDSGVQGAIGQYTKNAAAQVAQANTAGGPTAAADKLQQLVAQIPSGSASSQLAALVINESMPTIRNIIGQLPLPQPQRPADDYGVLSRLVGGPLQTGPTPQQQETQIVGDLSQVVEAAAAGEDSNAGTYDTKEIQDAVTGVAQAMATRPQAMPGPALRAAVGQGYATLALATAAQTRLLNPGELAPGSGVNTSSAAAFGSWKSAQLRSLLGNISAGLGDFQAKVNNAATSFTQSLTPLEAQSSFTSVLNTTQMDAGINAMVNGLPPSKQGPAVSAVPDLKKTIDTGLKGIAALGLQITRTDEAVTFYEHSLAGTPGYDTVENANCKLVTSPNGMAFQMASPQARERVTEQALRQALGSVGRAQLYSSGSQTLGDLTEFLAEESIKGSESASGSLTLLDTAGNQLLLNPDRVGHTPAALAWAFGGALQVGLTTWLAANSHPGGPLSTERKLLTLTIVGGFAGLHSGEALAAASRWFGSYVNSVRSGSTPYVKNGGMLDNLTRLTVEPTVGLIQGLTVLMGLASVSDATSLTYDITGMQQYPGGVLQTGVNIGAHGLNLLADVTLLQLQARGWAQQALGKTLLADPTTNAAFSAALSAQMLRALGIDVAGTGSPALKSAVETFLTKNPALAASTKGLLANLGTGAEQQKLAAVWARSVLASRGPLSRVFASLPDKLANKPLGWLVTHVPGLNTAFQGAVSAAKLAALGQEPEGPVNVKLVGAIKDFLGTDPTALLDGSKLLDALAQTGKQSLAASWALENPTLVTGAAGKLATITNSVASAYLDRFSSTVNALAKLLNPKIWAQALNALKNRLASEGASEAPAGVEAAIASELAGEGGEAAAGETVGEVAGLSNPIGWAVNLIYLGTTLGTTFFNQYGAVQRAQNNEYDFLRGAGIDDAHAAALKSYGLLTGVPASNGFVAAYALAGGDPNTFPGYVNSLPVGALKSALGAFSELNSQDQLPPTAAQDYWTLPIDPDNAAQRSFDPNLTYNTSLKRWEDKALNVYFQDGSWNVNDNSGNYYDPSNETMYLYSDMTGTSLPIHLPPASLAGIQAWFAFNNVSAPPTSGSPAPPSGSLAPTWEGANP